MGYIEILRLLARCGGQMLAPEHAAEAPVPVGALSKTTILTNVVPEAVFGLKSAIRLAAAKSRPRIQEAFGRERYFILNCPIARALLQIRGHHEQIWSVVLAAANN